jgi:3-oxoacyl-[acyl-carrier-protein] synthase II
VTAAGEVVITGFGAVTPVGNSRETTWKALTRGESGIGPVTAFDAEGLPTRIAGEVKDFDATGLLGAKRASRAARFSQFAIVAAREAVRHAGLVIDARNTSRVGVVVNCCVAGMGEIEAAARGLDDPQAGRLSPYFVPSVIPNMAACEVAIDLGVHGPVTAGALACASGSYAFLEARRLILADEADVVICGGTDASITPVMFSGLSSLGVMSKRNGEPARASRPFDADRDGFVYSEGAVIGVVEASEHARQRGARAHAAIAGGALTSDAFHIGVPEPSAAHPAAAISQAVKRSGLGAGGIDFICANGTSTRASDRIESAAIRAALGKHAYQVPVSAPKSMVGHLVGAAGALSVMMGALAMRDGVVPPTINLDTPDPECDLDYVANAARRITIGSAMVNAFGFGGQNCVAVLTRPAS